MLLGQELRDQRLLDCGGFVQFELRLKAPTEDGDCEKQSYRVANERDEGAYFQNHDATPKLAHSPIANANQPDRITPIKIECGWNLARRWQVNVSSP